MDCKKTIYYNLDTKEYYEVAKHVGFKTLDELFEKFGTDIEFKVESCNVTKKICEEIETFKSLCKKNKIKSEIMYCILKEQKQKDIAEKFDVSRGYVAKLNNEFIKFARTKIA